MSNTAQVSAGKRIEALLDDNSFVEIGSYVTARSTDFNMQEKETPADGVRTGYGTIEGNLVYVYSQDAAVLGGSVGEMHAKKINSLYGMAMKMGAPVIGLIDCAGMRLQEATDALEAFGGLYYSQAQASGVIPQISAVFGNCGGGMAVVPAMSDFVFMEKKTGKLFVNSPNALDGNYTEKCDTASADYVARESGLVDLAADESTVLAKIRELVAILPANNEDDLSYDECGDDLNRVCEDLDRYTADAAVALSMISDGNYFFETKPDYAKEMVTGFIRMNGNTVGVAANRTALYDEEGKETAQYDAVLTAQGAEKAAHFVDFCDAFEIPVVTFTNLEGYKATACQEKKMAKAAAKLVYAFANATVPKINVVTGKAYGSAYVAMNSKSLGADVVYAWPEASIGMMDAEAAAKIMYAEEIASAGAGASALIADKAGAYASLQSSAVAAAKRGYVDDIIEPQDTRKRLIAALEMLFTKREDRPAKKHGTV